MADPLSITVGILAIAGACSTSVRLLRSVHAAPQEMAHLERELQHLEDITKDVEALVIDNGNTSNALIKNMEDARVKMQQVHDFIHKRLYRISSSSVPVKVRRRDLIRQRTQLQAFAQEISGITARLADCIAITNF